LAELKRILGPWTAGAVVVGTIIGSGIFLVPSDMARAVGSPWMVSFVWIFGGVLSLFGALSYAELAAAMPEAGGDYVYLKAAYGPLLGFLNGWMITWIGKPASLAALGSAFYTYLADFFPVLQSPLGAINLPVGPGGGPLEIRYGQLLAIGIIAFVSAVNYLGGRIGGDVQVALTALKVALIGAVLVAGLFFGQAHAHNLTVAAQSQGGISGFFVALVAALWAYDGWSNGPMIGSEVDRPGKNLPLVLLAGTGAVITIYFLANLAYFSVLGGAGVAGSDRVATDMMRRVVGQPAGSVVTIAALISIFAAINGVLLSGARVPFAMARNGYFFKGIARIHPRFQTPSASIALLGASSSVLVLAGHYQELYTMIIFPEWIMYGLTAAAVIVLRKQHPELPRPYKVWGYPWVPAGFVVVALGLLFSTFRTSPRESGIGLGLLALGLPFYFYWHRRTQAGHRPDSQPAGRPLRNTGPN
jgi:APA family basic amino acid/polyamine antiporter